MTRAEYIRQFLASLDDLAVHPHYDGGKPERPSLGCDTVLSILLEEVHNWHNVPYAAIRNMFEALLASLPMHDVERLFACVSAEVECAERCTAEHLAEQEQRRTSEFEQRKTAILERLADELVEQWLRDGERRIGKAVTL